MGQTPTWVADPAHIRMPKQWSNALLVMLLSTDGRTLNALFVMLFSSDRRIHVRLNFKAVAQVRVFQISCSNDKSRAAVVHLTNMEFTYDVIRFVTEKVDLPSQYI